MSGWRPGPLKHWLDSNDSGTWGDEPNGHHDTLVVRSTDIRLDGSWDLADVAERSLPPSDRISKRLRVGDLVVVTSSGSPEHLGKTAIVGVQTAELNPCFSNFVQRLRPCPQADPRYVWHLLNSLTAASEMDALGNTTTGLRNLNGRILGSVTFPGPPLQTQRAIADFLDTETARIDALITKKRRLMLLLKAKLARERTCVIWPPLQPTTRLKYLTHPHRPIMYGIVLPGPDVDDGVPIVKGGDVGAGLCRPLAKTTREIEARYARSRLRLNDCLFAIRGGVGDVALVPEAVVGANITQDVARVAAGESVEPRWLFHVLRTDEVQSQAALRTTGATIRGLNIWELQQIEVPDVDSESQRRQVRELDEIEACVSTAMAKLEAQCSLLKEHRQALITVAVAGRLAIPGVAA